MKYSDIVKNLGDFVDLCVNYNIFCGLSVPYWEIEDKPSVEIDDWPLPDEIHFIPVKVKDYRVFAVYSRYGKPYFDPDSDLNLIPLSQRHFLEDGNIDVNTIMADFKLNRYKQEPFAGFIHFIKVIDENEISKTDGPSAEQDIFSRDLVRWLFRIASERIGKIFYENSDLLEKWRPHAFFIREMEESGPDLSDYSREIEKSLIQEIEQSSSTKMEAAYKKLEFLRTIFAVELEHKIQQARYRQKPDHRSMHAMYGMEYFEGMMAVLDSNDYHDYYSRILDILHTIKSGEGILSKRYAPKNKLLDQAKALANKMWSDGDKRDHVEMAKYLFEMAKSSSPEAKISEWILRVNLKEPAKKHNLLRGAKDFKKKK